MHVVAYPVTTTTMGEERRLSVVDFVFFFFPIQLCVLLALHAATTRLPERSMDRDRLIDDSMVD